MWSSAAFLFLAPASARNRCCLLSAESSADRQMLTSSQYNHYSLLSIHPLTSLTSLLNLLLIARCLCKTGHEMLRERCACIGSKFSSGEQKQKQQKRKEHQSAHSAGARETGGARDVAPPGSSLHCWGPRGKLGERAKMTTEISEEDNFAKKRK